ncbi:uncharacterized protein LOC118749554 [Rhagoletis pomonella]|uniref:uncharacterized protein LOC118749554 n=1 Tax=Rhagoletis pomonella TaxID=28610 RepID=UPI0017826DE2|nr:uncharacterized protein LOC118749554 [Rhagoletis pomonella]
MSENNAKEMWKHLKQAACLAEDNDGIKKVVIDGVLVENDTEVANKLNLFFINSVIEINRNIPCFDLVMNSSQTNCSFKFSYITTAEVINIIKTFKYKIGGRKLLSDGVLKDSIEYLGYFYALIINDSVESGIVPERWKTSTVVPVKKVKKTIQPEELRPINTLPSDAKILEVHVKNQLMMYLEENKILVQQQSGFREKHSCETALNLVIADWKEELNNKNVVVSVFLDLKRAFETVDRDILLKKLQRIGITGTELEWFSSYLKQRRQRTVINTAISEELEVPIGLPQGSVLAPILFLIYINDIVNAVEGCEIRLFADDALIMIRCGVYNYTDKREYTFKINFCASSTYGESTAIVKALQIAKETDYNKILIFTDSLSACKLLAKDKTKNHLIAECHKLIQEADFYNVTIIWTPSHVGISGNEIADSLAKTAVNCDNTLESKLTIEEALTSIRNSIHNKWYEEFLAFSNNKHNLFAQICTQKRKKTWFFKFKINPK